MQTLAAITVDVAFIAVVFVAFFFVRPELPKKKRASEDDLTSTWRHWIKKKSRPSLSVPPAEQVLGAFSPDTCGVAASHNGDSAFFFRDCCRALSFKRRRT